MERKNFFLIVTGLSGAGKTQALRALEDLGYFCVDNLPPSLIPKFLEVSSSIGRPPEKVALVMDVRGGEFFNYLNEALDFLVKKGFPYEILFLEASEETLVRRFKETRRRHPLSPPGGILEAIAVEKKKLEGLRERAHKIIDTSELTPQELKERIVALFAPSEESKLVIMVTSFGYKYGIPLDADLVVDVRFLPNPYYDENLRPFSGHDARVRDFVLSSPVTQEFLARFLDLLNFLIPYYLQERKTYLVIAVGCTGGRHRSVVLANEIGRRLKEQQRYLVLTSHRDLNRS